MTASLRPVKDPAIERHLGVLAASRDILPGAGQAWVRDLRSRAADALVRDGFPTTRIESWKYTDLRRVFRNEFAGQAQDIGALDISEWRAGDAGPVLVFIDGQFSDGLSSLDDLPAGARVMPLSAALAKGDSGIEGLLGSVAALESPGLTALNTALMQDGAFIRLDDDIELAEPVQVLCITSAGFSGETHLRHVVALGRHAKATIVQGHFAVGDSSGLCNVVTEAAVGEGASLHIVKRQEESRTAWHIGLVQARLARNASFETFTLSSGGQ